MPVHAALEHYVRSRDYLGVIALRGTVWPVPPILQEVLQGADSPDRFRRWDRLLGELPMIIASDARDGAHSKSRITREVQPI